MKRGIISNRCCAHCQLAVKDCCYVFWGCPVVRKILVVRCTQILSLLEVIDRFANLIWKLMKFDLTLVSIFLTISRGVWKFRDMKLFHNYNCLLECC